MIPLFLDLDGVLHPEHCRDEAHFCQLPILEVALEQLPLLQIVVSSTWRAKGAEALARHLSPKLRARIHGVTPMFSELMDVPEHLYAYHREAECTAWLRANGLLAFPWLALDDRYWLFRPFSKNLVLVNGRSGLQQGDVQELGARYSKLV